MHKLLLAKLAAIPTTGAFQICFWEKKKDTRGY